jgi:hypothetical protein
MDNTIADRSPVLQRCRRMESRSPVAADGDRVL